MSKTGDSLPAGLVHPSLLGLVGTNCSKIIRLVSGRTTVVIRGTVCFKILIICFGVLMARVGRIRKKNEKNKINIGKKVFRLSCQAVWTFYPLTSIKQLRYLSALIDGELGILCLRICWLSLTTGCQPHDLQFYEFSKR